MLVTQSHPTLCDPMNCSLPVSSALEILQARILEWGCHSFLQGILPTQGSNLGFPHCSGFFFFYHTTAKLLQSCPTLCDPIDGSPPVSPVPGILQARTLEWVAISFSNAWKWTVKVKSLSRVRLLATPRTAAHQAPRSMGFSGRGFWIGVPLPSPFYHRLCLKLSSLVKIF